MIEAHIPAPLMEELEKKWPEKCPHLDWSDREIWLYVGLRQLVSIFRASFDTQQKKASEKIL
jgi:hypothetical protein